MYLYRGWDGLPTCRPSLPIVQQSYHATEYTWRNLFQDVSLVLGVVIAVRSVFG